jgi:glycine/D-amino acid oxidase-like deaminating enzyme
MDVRSNEPYWLIKNSLGNSYPSLQESQDTDILIVGGGITGALVAYKLIRKGYTIVLVDKRDICNGSTAASTAMLQYEIDVPLHKLIALRGRECAVSSYKGCEQAIFDLEKIAGIIGGDCGFEHKQSIYFSSTKKDIEYLKKEFEARKENGFEVWWMEPDVLWELGLDAFGAIASKSGAVMDPYSFATDLLNYCTKNGMQIYDRTEISKVKQKNGKLRATTTTGFQITASHLVYCTGYESVEMLNRKVVDLKSTYAVASEAFEKLPTAFRDKTFWNTSDPYLYFRSTADGRIIAGGGDEKFKNATARDALISKKERSLVADFNKCFPKIDFRADYSWAGTFGETKDGLPYMGKADPSKNQHFFLGFGGNGITFSVRGMDAIIPSLNNQEHKYLNFYRFDR